MLRLLAVQRARPGDQRSLRRAVDGEAGRGDRPRDRRQRDDLAARRAEVVDEPRVTTRLARRFTSSWSAIRFVSCSANCPPMPMPAQLTRTSMPPYRSAWAATTRMHSSASPRFAGTASASSSSAASSSGSGRRAASVRSYPSCRSARARASPIPDDPPVTKADGTGGVSRSGLECALSPSGRPARGPKGDSFARRPTPAGACTPREAGLAGGDAFPPP